MQLTHILTAYAELFQALTTHTYDLLADYDRLLNAQERNDDNQIRLLTDDVTGTLATIANLASTIAHVINSHTTDG